MKLCKQCKQPQGSPHLRNCRMDLRGTRITRRGFFVRVEKSGIVQVCGRMVPGFLGYEIMLDGRRNGDWISWDHFGNNRELSWDLVERKPGPEILKSKINWPPEVSIDH